jgi:hypothetical protein
MPRSNRGSSDAARPETVDGIELDTATRAVEEAVLDALWRQWAVLGAGAAARGPARAVVDPEALVMASLWFLDREPRLGDLLASWVVSNSALLSMQRLRNVADIFPASAKDRVKGVARLAVERAKDFRWKPLIGRDVPALTERPGKTLSIVAPLERPPALMLRLRALLGVGMRADIIAFMVSDAADFVTSDDVAGATVYNASAVRRLLAQLSNAGGLRRQGEDAHARYAITGSSLARVAGPRPSAGLRWRFTAQVFAVVTEFLEWRRAASDRIVSPFAMEVKADELFNRHRRAFVAAGLVVPRPAPGAEQPSADHFVRLAEWLRTAI